MARDWKTTYAASVSSATHTATFPSAAVAGRKLVAFAVAPATVDPDAGWSEIADASDPIKGDLSAASLVAIGGETSITWVREPSAGTAPRTLAGWVESRDDLGALHGAPQTYPAPNGSGSIGLAPIVTTVDGCRIYVAVVTVNDATTWTPTFTGPVTLEDVVPGPGLGNEPVRLAVASGVVGIGSHNISISGLTNIPQAMVVALAVEPGNAAPPPAAETAIEEENRKTGVDQAVWDIGGGGDPTIHGFATAMSVARGTGLDVKVHSAAAWTGKVYRLGWYGSRGAREVGTITGPQTTQPSGTTDSTTGMVSCANWSVSSTWQVPADATPGVYIIRIARNDLPGAASHIGPFVVVDPSRKAKVAVKLSDSTWQAYNHAGADPADIFNGKNLYGQGTATGFTFGDAAQRCKAVSYDRPFVTRRNIPQTFIWNAEYPLIRWLERLGYDVDYLTCAQVDADPSLLLGRDVVISSGHDEYWSAGMRDAFIAARDNTTDPSHLLFLSGNEAFWRINWAPGRRSYSCWKDTLDGALNPTGVYSGTWQDARSFNPDRRAAALLNGQRFRLNGVASFPMAATAAHAASPLWRSTPVAALTGSQTWTSPDGVVGFEADEPADMNPTEKPSGLIRLSQVTHQVASMLSDDNGAIYTGSGPYTHALTAYRSPTTGAVVFGFGTVQYAWGLDDVHDRYPGSSTVSAPLQQALTNLLADVGVLPPAYPFPAGLVRPTAVALSTYGLPNPTPGPDPDPDPEDPLYGYATVGQLTEHLGRTPVNAAQLLRRASRDVDRALLCAVYDPTDPDVVSVLREATLEQIAANLDHGNVTGNGGSRRGGFTIGRLTVQAGSSDDAPVRIGSLWEQAWDILQSAGLTGHAPQSR